MKTLDMVSPADPIDTTSSAAGASRIQVLDLLAGLSRRLEGAQLVDLVVHAGELMWVRVPVGFQEGPQGGQGVGAARSPERARTRPLDGLEGHKA
ncbi:hypothetical protein [Pseudomonas aeruginosa]|uniref:hypothetical protein n=1 Tax=Pseudomonas aeruginosa TaxID=287 RepID=UPI00106B7579|nr:hypothetical protein [Pseudomonas aeruginosa]